MIHRVLVDQVCLLIRMATLARFFHIIKTNEKQEAPLANIESQILSQESLSSGNISSQEPTSKELFKSVNNESTVRTPKSAKRKKETTSKATPRQQNDSASPSPMSSTKKRKKRCGSCAGCLKEDCGKCIHCIDMPRFGGSNKLRQACKRKGCCGSSRSLDDVFKSQALNSVTAKCDDVLTDLVGDLLDQVCEGAKENRALTEKQLSKPKTSGAISCATILDETQSELISSPVTERSLSLTESGSNINGPNSPDLLSPNPAYTNSLTDPSGVSPSQFDSSVNPNLAEAESIATASPVTFMYLGTTCRATQSAPLTSQIPTTAPVSPRRMLRSATGRASPPSTKESQAGLSSAGTSLARMSSAGPSAAGPSSTGPLAAGPSSAGPSSAGPSSAGPSSAGPSAAGPSAAGQSLAGQSSARPSSWAAIENSYIMNDETTGACQRNSMIDDLGIVKIVASPSKQSPAQRLFLSQKEDSSNLRRNKALEFEDRREIFPLVTHFNPPKFRIAVATKLPGILKWLNKPLCAELSSTERPFTFPVRRTTPPTLASSDYFVESLPCRPTTIAKWLKQLSTLAPEFSSNQVYEILKNANKHADRSTDPWTDIYRPKNVAEFSILGNRAAVQGVKRWLDSWTQRITVIASFNRIVTRRKKQKQKPGASSLLAQTPGGRKRRGRCRVCAGCTMEDCGKCKHCLDKPKFGGSGRMKQACMLKVCTDIVWTVGPLGASLPESQNSTVDFSAAEKAADSEGVAAGSQAVGEATVAQAPVEAAASQDAVEIVTELCEAAVENEGIIPDNTSGGETQSPTTEREYVEEYLPLKDDDSSSILLLTGPHGTGKSTCVHMLAEQLGYRVFEVNPGMLRTSKLVYEQFQESTQSQTVVNKNSSPLSSFFKTSSAAPNADAPPTTRTSVSLSKFSLLLFDEVDVVFETDRGFFESIRRLAVEGSKPIILTASSESIVHRLTKLTDLIHIRFLPPKPAELEAYLTLVNLVEGSTPDSERIHSLVDENQANIQQCLHQLQFEQLTVNRPTLEVSSLDSGELEKLPAKFSLKAELNSIASRVFSDVYGSRVEARPSHGCVKLIAGTDDVSSAELYSKPLTNPREGVKQLADLHRYQTEKSPKTMRELRRMENLVKELRDVSININPWSLTELPTDVISKDYIPFIQSLCHSEVIREIMERKNHRFVHRLDQVNLSINERTRGWLAIREDRALMIKPE